MPSNGTGDYARTASRCTSKPRVRSPGSPRIRGATRISPAPRSPTTSMWSSSAPVSGDCSVTRARRGKHPAHRQGRRRGRHLVLESVPRYRVRRRIVCLHAASGGTRLRPVRQICQGRRDFCALPTHRRALWPVPRRCLTDPAFSAHLEDGWQRHRIENFQLLTAGGEAEDDLVDDAWTSIVSKLFVICALR
jgi:hypothetical protein